VSQRLDPSIRKQAIRSQKKRELSKTRKEDLGSLFLGSLDGGLGDLTGLVGLLNGLDDTDGDGLSHVTNSETSKRWVVSESLNAHRLGWNHLDDSSISGLDELRLVFDRFTSTTINLLQDLRELAGNVGSVAIKDWA